MVLSPQILTATLVAGVAIIAPVYLLTSNTNKSFASPRLVHFISEVVGKDSKISETLQEVKCGIFDANATNQLSEEFLKEQKKDPKLYVLVSCRNNTDVRENVSLLGIDWNGLLPKDVLQKVFSFGSEKQFSMSIQTTLENKNLGNVVTIFSNSESSASIRIRWVDLLDTSHFSSKKAILTAIEGVEQE